MMVSIEELNAVKKAVEDLGARAKQKDEEVDDLKLQMDAMMKGMEKKDDKIMKMHEEMKAMESRMVDKVSKIEGPLKDKVNEMEKMLSDVVDDVSKMSADYEMTIARLTSGEIRTDREEQLVENRGLNTVPSYHAKDAEEWEVFRWKFTQFCWRVFGFGDFMKWLSNFKDEIKLKDLMDWDARNVQFKLKSEYFNRQLWTCLVSEGESKAFMLITSLDDAPESNGARAWQSY